MTGGDIIAQLKDKPKGDILAIPQSMLRDGEDIFLDDSTVDDVEKALGMPIVPIMNDGYEFIEKLIGCELEF